MKMNKLSHFLLFSLILVVTFLYSAPNAYALDLGDYYEEETTTLSAEDMKEFAGGKTTYYEVSNTTEQLVNEASKYTVLEEEEWTYLLPNMTDTLGFYTKLHDAIKDKDLGTFVEHDKIIVEDSDNNIVTAKTTLQFTNGNLQFVASFKCFQNMGLTPVEVDFTTGAKASDAPKAKQDTAKAKQDTAKAAQKKESDNVSLSDKLKEAGINTIMGMGTVFIVLILISLIIYCFKYLNMASNYFENKNKKQEPAKATENIISKQETEENYVDDLELVAVITAAIAASSQTGDGFVVRSIRKR